VPTTSRLALPYPTDDDDNDVAGDLLALATKLDTDAAVDLQGTFASRPAAGTRGRFYWATDKKALYRDDGTAWQLIIQDWTDYSIVVYPIDSAGTGSGWAAPLIVADSANRARYQIVGKTCHVSVRQKVQLTTGGGFEYAFSLPVAARYDRVAGPAGVQGVSGQVITLPKSSAYGQSGSDVSIVSIRKYNAPSGTLTVPSTTFDNFDIEYEIP
jgi:hypothetical protein